MQGTIQIGREILTFMRGEDYDDAHKFGPSNTICYSINTIGLGASTPFTVPKAHFLKVLEQFLLKSETSFSYE